MSLHDENGIAPDAGVRGPKDREENPHDLAPEGHLEEDPLSTDPGTDTDAESEHTR